MHNSLFISRSSLESLERRTTGYFSEGGGEGCLLGYLRIGQKAGHQLSICFEERVFFLGRRRFFILANPLDSCVGRHRRAAQNENLCAVWPARGAEASPSMATGPCTGDSVR
jgi:hypothetical protein